MVNDNSSSMSNGLTKHPIRVLLADDHGLMRAGLRALLQPEPDIHVVGEAQDGAEALRLAANLCPDVILADISMPPTDGIEVARLLSQSSPSMRVLILTMHEDGNLARDAMAAGARGYIIKRALEAELTTAIRLVAKGQSYVHRDLAISLPGPAHTSPQLNLFGSGVDDCSELSDVEAKVLVYLAHACTTAEIANRLALSAAEVERYRQALCERCGLRSRVEIVRYVRHMNLEARVTNTDRS
jgi:DNA-binding NarL/FixJ family response regulator